MHVDWNAVSPLSYICMPIYCICMSVVGWLVGWLCWGLTSQSTIFQSCRDGAIASWVINQYFQGVKCLAQGHNMAAVGLEPRTSRSGVRHSTTEPPRSPMYVSQHTICNLVYSDCRSRACEFKFLLPCRLIMKIFLWPFSPFFLFSYWQKYVH